MQRQKHNQGGKPDGSTLAVKACTASICNLEPDDLNAGAAINKLELGVYYHQQHGWLR